MIRCDVPGPTGARCERARSHRGDHAGGGEQWPRGARGGARNLETSSIVLSALAAGASYEAAGAAAGVTKQRAAAIAAAAGGRPETTDAALLARLRELAAIDQDDPSSWLEDAAACAKACAEIVEVITWARRQRDPEATGVLMDQILAWATGRNPPELAAQVRGAVDAAAN